jgi:hypothetical protein
LCFLFCHYSQSGGGIEKQFNRKIKMSKISISDDSGDKKYFTIIPNYILNHSTLWDREVYIQMKRITGEDGTCWTSKRTLTRQCGMSKRRLDKSIEYLVEHKWIKLLGKKEVITKGGVQEVNEYKIIDLWDLNNTFYQEKFKDKGGAPKTPPCDKGGAQNTQRGCTVEAKGGAQNDYKEEPILRRTIEEEKTEQSSGEIPLLIKSFETINPDCKNFYDRPPQRLACQFLIDTYGFERVKTVIEKTLPKTNTIKFFPTITTPMQLKEKWASLESQVHKYQSDVMAKKEKYKVAFTS